MENNTTGEIKRAQSKANCFINLYISNTGVLFLYKIANTGKCIHTNLHIQQYSLLSELQDAFEEIVLVISKMFCIYCIVGWGESLTNWLLSNIWRKKVWRINRSTNRLLLVSTNLSLPNHGWFGKLTKLSCYTVYSMISKTSSSSKNSPSKTSHYNASGIIA